MIGAEAGRALDLIQGIEVCRETGPEFWKGIVTRIVYDLDETGAHKQVAVIRHLLWNMWIPLPEKPVPATGDQRA